MTGSQALLFLALAVLAARLARLGVLDEFPPVRAVRYWFARTFATSDPKGNIIPDPKAWGRFARAAWSIAYVWTCPWCMSIWTGLGVWGGAVWIGHIAVPLPWAMIALGSYISGWDGNLQSEHEQRWKLRQETIDERERVKAP
jgi:uncharacterized protein DUF1360